MRDRKLHPIEPTPEHGDRAILKPDTNPALVGEGQVTLSCGICESVLAQAVRGDQVFDVAICCSDCGAVNDTASAVGGHVEGSVVYLPVGTYRLGKSVRLPGSVPMIGEPFPGAGPPSADGIIALDE